MFKYVFAYTLCLLICLQGLAQNSLILVKPEGSKNWGFVDLNGQYVINAQYRKVGSFTTEGYAPVLDKHAYFINSKGEKLNTELSNYKLKNVFGLGMQGFSDGMAAVNVEGKWGYIGTDGKTVINPQFENCTKFNDGYAAVKVNGGWSVIDNKGNLTKINVSQLKNVRAFSDGLAIFDTHEKLFGYINTKGEVVIEAKFRKVGSMINGITWAKDLNNKTGFIDKAGNWKIEPKYDAAKNFDPSTGMARVKVVDQWFYINQSGEELKISLEKYGDFSEGLCSARKGELTGFINSKGEWLIEPQFEGARDFKNGYAAVKKGGKWGIINKKGEWVIEAQFIGIKDVVTLK